MAASTLPRSFPPTAMTARHRRVIELRAQGQTIPKIAKELTVTEDACRKLLRRALRASAADLLSRGAWEEAAALYVMRLDAQLEVWLPRSLAEHRDKDAADVVRGLMNQYADLYGFKTLQIVASPSAVDEPQAERAAATSRVLGTLEALAARHGLVVDAELVEESTNTE